MRSFLEVAGFVLGATVLYGLGLLVLTLLAVGIGQVLFMIRGRGSRPAGPPDFTRLRGRMKRAETTTLLLAPAKTPGLSKLGGAPELPEGVAWPFGPPPGSYAFVAQIDLNAFRAHVAFDWLPMEGRIYVFVDEQRYGFADLVRVIYSTEAPGPERSAPAKARVFPERRVAFETYRSIPSLDWLGAEDANLSDAELDQLADLPGEPFGDEIQHRIGGYPSEIQSGRMHVECELMRRGLRDDAEVTDAILRAARQWRLLLQVDSDSALKMNWGDGGRLYVFIREADARKGDFSKTVTLTQCY